MFTLITHVYYLMFYFLFFNNIEELVCKQDEFMCDNRCIPAYMRCDRTVDCDDKTDELNCADTHAGLYPHIFSIF